MEQVGEGGLPQGQGRLVCKHTIHPLRMSRDLEVKSETLEVSRFPSHRKNPPSSPGRSDSSLRDLEKTSDLVYFIEVRR
jgi:hypothetical protein